MSNLIFSKINGPLISGRICTRYLVVFVLNVLLLTGQNSLNSQTSSGRSVAAMVQLDSIVVVAQRQGFDVEDFVEMVQNDQSFYKAFRNLRKIEHRFTCQMEFRNKKNKQLATYQARNHQTVEGDCREMSSESENHTGKFYKGKKEKHRFYTAKMYERLFCTIGRVCESKTSDQPDVNGDEEENKMESNVSELKKLIFHPGERARVPLIGKKTAIFNEKMAECYDFKIESKERNGHDCYVFTAVVKPEFVSKKNKTVIKSLATYFDRETFQIVARDYRISNGTIAYKFDITMNVDVVKVGRNFVPSRIEYSGFWNIPAKKIENGSFTIAFFDFQI